MWGETEVNPYCPVVVLSPSYLPFYFHVYDIRNPKIQETKSQVTNKLNIRHLILQINLLRAKFFINFQGSAPTKFLTHSNITHGLSLVFVALTAGLGALPPFLIRIRIGGVIISGLNKFTK